MVCLIPKFDHITPVLIGLHWLPVRYRVIFKILLLVYKALHANAPPYISDLLTPKHIGCYSLRSNEQNLLIVPKTMRKTFGDRAFAKAGPFLWNELPLTFVKRQQWKLLKADLRPFFLKRHFIFKYNSKFELPAHIREASTVETFKNRFKTFLFLKRHFIFKYNSKF